MEIFDFSPEQFVFPLINLLLGRQIRNLHLQGLCLLGVQLGFCLHLLVDLFNFLLLPSGKFFPLTFEHQVMLRLARNIVGGFAGLQIQR